MTRLILCYRGDGPPPGEDLAAIAKAGAKDLNQRDSGLIELDIKADRARELERQLPHWDLSPIGYYGIPEFGLPLVPSQPSKPADLSPAALSELADKIHFYLRDKGNQVALAKVMSAMTNREIKWQQVIAAIKSQSDLHEDGKTVWIDPT